MDSSDPLYFNGINASTGAYLFPPVTAEALARELTGEPPPEDPRSDHLAELKDRVENKRTAHYGVKSGIDVKNLGQTGWAAVFPAYRPDTPEARLQDEIAEALMPLFQLRREQATASDERLFKIYRGIDGYRPNETKQKYLARLGAGPGPADPIKVPYYLLIVGGPDELPYSVQFQLDVQYAVGRIHFDTVAAYANYARSVVAAETGGLQLSRELAMFGVANSDDPATRLSAENLVAPLADLLVPSLPDWKITRYEGAHATKANLARLLGGDATPALLFTASHGAGFDRGDARQRSHQGALLCQDWPGPVAWKQPLTPDFYYAGEDVQATARPHGLIMFNFACYGAGTPLYNDYGQRSGAKEREQIADHPFLAALPQRLLAHPTGGALATIGHVERAWGTSFAWRGSGKKSGSSAQLAVFESAMRELMSGAPVGAALECFNERYAELASDLSVELEEISFNRAYNALELTDMWTANNDARSYTIIGDPAVRLPLAPTGGATRRLELPSISLRSAAPTTSVAATQVVAASAPAPASTPPATTVVSTPAASPPATPVTTTATPPTPTAPASPAAAATTATTATAGEPAGAFGLLALLRGKTGAELGPFQQFAQTLAQTLERALAELGTLEVRTFVAQDLKAAGAASAGELAGHAELRAFTRVSVGGDVDSCVPATGDVLDDRLWALHREMVQQAQAHRAELLRALLDASGNLLKLG
ncbi:MAG: hypothetical protein IPO88_15710 [Nannocystis sp.]|uniref:C25 family cysteine peptidase n=1 Tax=Nannocystis sp. TaxID=1962667 RepID=UPI0024209411|nr:C25 family cysteine peptidase [Nannocystis sp.]MBK9754913.1 hypothetical protein [Nannocystis sp.]